MRFTVDRNQMSAVCKNFARIVLKTSPIEDLTGILFDADENSGSLRLVATNMEVSLEHSLMAIVSEGGRMVINGKLLADMMPLLKEDTVSFSTLPAGNAVGIACGSIHYDVSYLSGQHFPEPGVSLPENMVKIYGLLSLSKKTAFAAKKKAASPGDMLVNAKLDVYPSEIHMTCTDGSMLAVARQPLANSGRASLLIPERAPVSSMRP